ncbi:hypothetical protein DPMN_110011 [Dreissena polymorpha]|uniref:Uncharacterized protein n=1 Tax=Dreissena polymorpha TaxID=45954 RepID=A0A9D4QNL0_DREPO|nr:hypothetical protein DPMN_110011 [Dreissena polymorpha]
MGYRLDFRIVTIRRLGGALFASIYRLVDTQVGQHLKKGCGTLKNISLDHLGNNVDFKRYCPGCRVLYFLLQVKRVFKGLVSTEVVQCGRRFT